MRNAMEDDPSFECLVDSSSDTSVEIRKAYDIQGKNLVCTTMYK